MVNSQQEEIQMTLKIMGKEKFQNLNLKLKTKKKKKNRTLISKISHRKYLIWMIWWINLSNSVALAALHYNPQFSHKYINQAIINILIRQISMFLSIIHLPNITFHNTNLNHNTSLKYKIIKSKHKSEAHNITLTKQKYKNL